MIIKSKLTEKDFINVTLVLLYSKTSFKIFTGTIITFFLVTLFTVVLIPKVTLSQMIVPVVMLSIAPLFTYFTAKKNYNSNQTISEAIEYQFDKDNLIVKGESFNSQLTWDKIYRVTQTKNWILIWQNSQIANPIPKRDIWEGEIESLKVILNEHRVKNNL